MVYSIAVIFPFSSRPCRLVIYPAFSSSHTAVRIASVSYTHLNVVAVSGFIKNQSSCFLCHHKILLWVGLQAFALVAGVVGYALASCRLDSAPAVHIVRYKGRVIAVSYTHLDVYKRQIIFHIASTSFYRSVCRLFSSFLIQYPTQGDCPL